ncbi:hypothetical protein EHW66_10960 [Erwinia psidii]|uniref:Uncharacterized protein n=1 Tax=Erwinia psidii TaxID=69224 RepID=A0A3N6S211_9GAMM|nr:hypothetical protein [Erwinia psidii]MCX8961067.1 hypothetical protein [Erwinia psidii]MCX8965504.1 hypothetical protein [Erwinia psidii]RQM38867.1 hypothetical protein EB241_06625 [Erwinia psidii]
MCHGRICRRHLFVFVWATDPRCRRSFAPHRATRIIFCGRRRSLRGMGVMIGKAQPGWFGDGS